MFHGMNYIYAVYKEGSFSKAAKSLFISQPSLSATVKRIEEKVGYPIFDRSTKPCLLYTSNASVKRAVSVPIVNCIVRIFDANCRRRNRFCPL